MKLVKQPLFLAGVSAIVFSIVLAIVGTVVNPSSSVMNKFEKAINKKDAKVLAQCISPTVSVGQDEYSSLLLSLESMAAMLGVTGNLEYELLVGEAEEVETEKEYELKDLPCIMVIKSNGRVLRVTTDEQRIVEIDGKEYLYTGLE